MGRIYTATFADVAVSAQQDLFELVAPSDAIVLIHQIEISQLSDVGDAQEEMLSIRLKSGATTSGSGGSAITPVPISVGDVAFGGTCEANNTTKATLGTIVTHYAWAWNVRMDFNKLYVPELRPILSPSHRLTVELATTPADALTMSGVITFEEVGG